MEAYVSRDRIARGMALNSFIGFWVSCYILNGDIETTIMTICLSFFTVSILAWFRLRRLSKAFKTQAIIQLAARESQS